MDSGDGDGIYRMAVEADGSRRQMAVVRWS
jgi:hypothetical protein